MSKRSDPLRRNVQNRLIRGGDPLELVVLEAMGKGDDPNVRADAGSEGICDCLTH